MESPGVLRRFAAICYDLLPLAGIGFVATAVLLPFIGADAIAPETPTHQAYLAGVAFAYYGWFWTHGGQTPGMRAWDLRIASERGGTLSWGQAFTRFTVAIVSWLAGGAGYLWATVGPEHRTWHGRASGTRVWVEPR